MRLQVKQEVFSPTGDRFNDTMNECLMPIGGGIGPDQSRVKYSHALNSFVGQSRGQVTNKDLNLWQFRHREKGTVLFLKAGGLFSSRHIGCGATVGRRRHQSSACRTKGRPPNQNRFQPWTNVEEREPHNIGGLRRSIVERGSGRAAS